MESIFPVFISRGNVWKLSESYDRQLLLGCLSNWHHFLLPRTRREIENMLFLLATSMWTSRRSIASHGDDRKGCVSWRRQRMFLQRWRQWAICIAASIQGRGSVFTVVDLGVHMFPCPPSMPPHREIFGFFILFPSSPSLSHTTLPGDHRHRSWLSSKWSLVIFITLTFYNDSRRHWKTSCP